MYVPKACFHLKLRPHLLQTYGFIPLCNRVWSLMFCFVENPFLKIIFSSFFLSAKWNAFYFTSNDQGDTCPVDFLPWFERLFHLFLYNNVYKYIVAGVCIELQFKSCTYPQVSQIHGFSFVWRLLCAVRAAFEMNPALHTSQVLLKPFGIMRNTSNNSKDEYISLQ